MPIYEYVCDACGLEKDFIQRMSAEPLKACPACQEDALRKKISAAGFRLKGNGWYETDFKTGSKKNLASESGSTPAADTASKDSSPANNTTSAAAS
jgi:putative FmdB family regulatory protein